jgi:serine/threonine protein kinase
VQINCGLSVCRVIVGQTALRIENLSVPAHGVLSGQIVRPTLNNRDNPAPTLDSQNVQTKLDSAVPTHGDAEATLGSAPAVEAAAKRDLASIGPYRLLKKLGEGGMGQVWLAEQTSPLRRQVALKLIKVGVYDDSVLQRFLSERQSLAIMDHPSIAKVFDAGATSDGQPYFVMEYVPGVPITIYCDQKQLTVRERLELFIKVCEGVQHAHQKAIIHRDLKPANILVAEVDGKPTPRIIDFGLAKAAAPLPTDETLYTQIGTAVGLPGYMSPEQADSRIQDVDTRTDVYSLGVVLYVLLTGELPFDPKQWQKLPLHEVLRQLREEDPPRPSTQFSKKTSREAEAAAATAQVRQTVPKQLINVLRGDLDWITMKALEKDRARRYGTPSELAADIGRYLHNEPVVARPASRGYRLQKYVRRHRFGAAAAAGLVILLIAFAVMQAVQLRRITRERDRANRITDFMTGMFKVSDPSEAHGSSITAREILDKASSDIDTGLSKDPELQAQMMNVMGNVYDNLGLYPRAESLLTRAVDTRRHVLGPKNNDTLASSNDLGWVLQEQGHYTEAEKLVSETLETSRHVLGPENAITQTSMDRLAWIYYKEGRYAEAEKLHRQTLDIRRRVLGPEHPDTLESMDGLAGTFLARGPLLRDREVGPRDARYSAPCSRAGTSPHASGDAQPCCGFSWQGNYAEAEKLYREVLDIERRVLGPEHPGTLQSMEVLAVDLAHEGRYDEAEKMQFKARDSLRQALGPEHPGTALSTDSLACIFALAGNHDEALALARGSRPRTPSLCRSLHRGRYGSPIASRRPALRRPCCPRQRARRRSREEVKQWREGNFFSGGKRVGGA